MNVHTNPSKVQRLTAPPIRDEAWRVIPGPKQDSAPDPTRLLVCAPASRSETMQAYGQYIGDLLGGQTAYLEMSETNGIDTFKQAACACDLAVFGEPTPTLTTWLRHGRTACKAAQQTPTSILIARQPRWPIQKILLVLRVEATDQAAVNWVCRLARPSGADVTILPIVPSLPAMYSQGAQVQTELGVLLSPNTPSGRQIRHLAQQFVEWEITGTMRLRQGEPNWQIQTETTETAYDLVVIGAEPHPRWQRWLLGELVSPLLRWAFMPVLVAKGNGRE